MYTRFIRFGPPCMTTCCHLATRSSPLRPYPGNSLLTILYEGGVSHTHVRQRGWYESPHRRCSNPTARPARRARLQPSTGGRPPRARQCNTWPVALIAAGARSRWALVDTRRVGRRVTVAVAGGGEARSGGRARASTPRRVARVTQTGRMEAGACRTRCAVGMDRVCSDAKQIYMQSNPTQERDRTHRSKRHAPPRETTQPHHHEVTHVQMPRARVLVTRTTPPRPAAPGRHLRRRWSTIRTQGSGDGSGRGGRSGSNGTNISIGGSRGRGGSGTNISSSSGSGTNVGSSTRSPRQHTQRRHAARWHNERSPCRACHSARRPRPRAGARPPAIACKRCKSATYRPPQCRRRPCQRGRRRHGRHRPPARRGRSRRRAKTRRSDARASRAPQVPTAAPKEERHRDGIPPPPPAPTTECPRAAAAKVCCRGSPPRTATRRASLCRMVTAAATVHAAASQKPRPRQGGRAHRSTLR